MGKSFDGLRRVTGEEDKSIPQDPVGTGNAMLKKGAGSMEQGGFDQGVIKRGGAGEDGCAQRGKSACEDEPDSRVWLWCSGSGLRL